MSGCRERGEAERTGEARDPPEIGTERPERLIRAGLPRRREERESVGSCAERSAPRWSECNEWVADRRRAREARRRVLEGKPEGHAAPTPCQALGVTGKVTAREGGPPHSSLRAPPKRRARHSCAHRDDRTLPSRVTCPPSTATRMPEASEFGIAQERLPDAVLNILPPNSRPTVRCSRPDDARQRATGVPTPLPGCATRVRPRGCDPFRDRSPGLSPRSRGVQARRSADGAARFSCRW